MRINPEVMAQVNTRWSDILNAVREGISLRDVCTALAIPRAAVWQYRIENPKAAGELRDAWHIGADALVDDLDRTILTTPDARLARVRAEFIWKRAAASNPDRYADRQRHDHRVVTFALRDVLEAAQARLDARAARTIEHDAGAARAIEPDAGAQSLPVRDAALLAIL